MGSTPIHALPYPELTSPADVPSDIRALAMAVDAFKTAPPLVSTLPSSPANGDEIYFATASGVIWHLRYDSAISDAYKWRFVGGSMMFAAEAAGPNSTASTTYVDLPGGPSISAPLAGVYQCQGFALVSVPTGAAFTAIAALRIGTAATVDNDRVAQLTASTTNGATTLMTGRTLERTLPTAGPFSLQYRSGGAFSSTYYSRTLGIVPVRVG